MSLILDALQRAQREPRSRDGVPGVDSLHLPGQRETGGWRRALPWIALAVALIAVAGLLWERRSATAPVDARPAVREQPAGPGAASAAVPEATSRPGNPADEPAVGAVPSTGANKRPAPIESSPAVESAVDAPRVSGPSSTGLPLPEPAVTALYQRSSSATRSPAAAETPVAEEPVAAAPPDGGDAPVRQTQRVADAVAEATPPSKPDIEALVAKAESALAQSKLSEHPSPFLSELSQVDKDAVPTIYYSRHEYNAQGGATVVLNGQSLAAGEAVGGGVRVEEILEDSVVLSHHGVEFRLKALNSWVNL